MPERQPPSIISSTDEDLPPPSKSARLFWRYWWAALALAVLMLFAPWSSGESAAWKWMLTVAWSVFLVGVACAVGAGIYHVNRAKHGPSESVAWSLVAAVCAGLFFGMLTYSDDGSACIDHDNRGCTEYSDVDEKTANRAPAQRTDDAVARFFTVGACLCAGAGIAYARDRGQ